MQARIQTLMYVSHNTVGVNKELTPHMEPPAVVYTEGKSGKF